jgi:periplasmic protein TonB
MQGQDSSQVADADQYELNFSQEPAGRCGSCGGPSTAPDGDLCDSCQQAFSSVLGNASNHTTTASEPVELPELLTLGPAHLAPESTSSVETHSTSLELSPSSVEPQSSPEAAAVEAFADAISAAVSATVEPVTESAAPAPEADAALPAADALPVVATASEVVATPEVVAAPEAVAASAVAAAAVPASRGLRAEVVAAAVVLVVAAVGVPTGALWLQRQVAARKAAAQAPEQPASVPEKSAPVARAVAPPANVQTQPDVPAVQPEPRPTPPPTPTMAARPQQAVAPARAVRAPKVPVKGDRQAAAATQPVAPVVAAAMAPAPAAVIVPPPAPVVQQPLAVVPEAPSGKLFDPSEVDVTPRIASRVDPRLPGNLTGRPGSDVVVVRILVSQSGHAFRVNLLRRSRLGPSVDEAVVEAVKQWTFTPARKRGDAVSCWFNVGVSLTAN